MSSALSGRFFTTSTTWKAQSIHTFIYFYKNQQFLQIKEGIELSTEFNIDRRIIEIVWSNLSFVYTGLEVKPTATVGNIVGTDECNITVEGSYIDAGNYTSIATDITGADSSNYVLPTTNLETPWKITSANINTTIISAIENQYYTGSAIEPKPVIEFVINGEKVTLLENTDYTLSYLENVELGTATIVHCC